MNMNPDQKAGTLIVLIAATLIAMTLVLSDGWGIPNFNLQLVRFEYKSDEGYGNDYFIVYTRYVLAALIAVVGYGFARYFGLIAAIFRKTKPSKTTKEELE